MNCPHCAKLGFEMPMKKDGHLWRCRLCGYTTEEERVNEGTEQENPSMV